MIRYSRFVSFEHGPFSSFSVQDSTVKEYISREYEQLVKERDKHQTRVTELNKTVRDKERDINHLTAQSRAFQMKHTRALSRLSKAGGVLT